MIPRSTESAPEGSRPSPALQDTAFGRFASEFPVTVQPQSARFFTPLARAARFNVRAESSRGAFRNPRSSSGRPRAASGLSDFPGRPSGASPHNSTRSHDRLGLTCSLERVVIWLQSRRPTEGSDVRTVLRALPFSTQNSVSLDTHFPWLVALEVGLVPAEASRTLRAVERGPLCDEPPAAEVAFVLSDRDPSDHVPPNRLRALFLPHRP